MGALIYPVFGNWVWGGGLLAKLGQSWNLGHGAVDFAGSGRRARHRWLDGARARRDARAAASASSTRTAPRTPSPATTSATSSIGTLILVFGWMGFNPGSTFGATDLRICVVAVNTLLAACFGFVTAMAYTNHRYGKPDISMSCNGMLAGLVAITAPCAFVAPVGGGRHRRHRRLHRLLRRVVLRSRRPRRRSRAVPSPSTASAAPGACSPSACSPTAPTARAGTAWRATSRACSTATAASSSPRSSSGRRASSGRSASCGSSSRSAKRFMKIRVTRGGRAGRSRRAGVRQRLLPRLRARHLLVGRPGRRDRHLRRPGAEQRHLGHDVSLAGGSASRRRRGHTGTDGSWPIAGVPRRRSRRRQDVRHAGRRPAPPLPRHRRGRRLRRDARPARYRGSAR